ncbi:unnamed protein product [Spirodela intermedia]|uniref:Protein kinase domain-containing protein n=1 Tax=Spirodela intermedia TaxID=51605 RepID=A0A7I8JFR1_SPIIN|nr:unnamed protein product [Spirodela intermedia]CAA6668979.1 unnamed protein product [Spirodela intermedia]
MGYLSCKAQASVITCRSISSVVEHPAATAGASSAAGTPRNDFAGTRGGGKGKARAAAGDGGEEEVAAEDRRKNQALQVPRRVRVFSYTELEAATSHFSEQNLLGRGSHGSVYRAILRPSGRFVAVKRPSRLQHFHHRPSGGGSGRFLIIERNEVENEIDILSRIHNPRLVNLVGVSTYDDSTAGDDEAPSCSPSPAAIITSSSSSTSSFRRERLLVVEYMPNGTLYELLHSNPHPPGWARRLRLALQTAKAIHALHSCTPPVIHRDVKSANVLMIPASMRALGTSVLLSALPTTIDATCRHFGLSGPRLHHPENLSTKTDVFSFGILLIEIMSGRKAIDVAHSPPSVVEWAVPLLRKGKVLSLYDPRIPPPKDPAARRQLACLAASCVRSVKEKRPSMEEVIVCLKLLYKTLPSKTWTSGLSVRNPCLMVEAVESTHNKKPSRTDIEVTTLSPVASCASPARESEDNGRQRNAHEEIPLFFQGCPPAHKFKEGFLSIKRWSY